jgi:predicted transcriptional regulator
MKVKDIAKLLNAKPLCGEELYEMDVMSASSSDMMSDILVFVKNQSILITGLMNVQVVRTAEMMDMKCVVFVRGKVPDQTIIELAEDSGICVLATEHTMYEASGILYINGLGRGE